MSSTDWKFAQQNPADRLAQLHYFSVMKSHMAGEIEIVITVKEYVTAQDPSAPFFAIADKQTNQRTAPYTPNGWGHTLLEALSQCVENVHRFPYEPPDDIGE